MWDHPLTGMQLRTMQEMGARIIPPVEKTLACGDTGNGAMASVRDIVRHVAAATLESMRRQQALAQSMAQATVISRSASGEAATSTAPKRAAAAAATAPTTAAAPGAAQETDGGGEAAAKPASKRRRSRKS